MSTPIWRFLKSEAAFGFEKLSQAKKLGPRFWRGFSPRVQAGVAAGAANCRFEKLNAAELKTAERACLKH